MDVHKLCIISVTNTCELAAVAHSSASSMKAPAEGLVVIHGDNCTYQQKQLKRISFLRFLSQNFLEDD